MEIVDIVNEKDQIIGQISRHEAHAKDILHRSSHVWVIRSDGTLVVQHRSRRKSSFPLHMAMSAAGHVVSGETYEIAAHKELSEELGIEAKLDFIGMYRQIVPGIENEFCAMYIVKHDGPYTNWEEEAESLLFLTPSEIKMVMAKNSKLFTPGFLLGFELLEQKLPELFV